MYVLQKYPYLTTKFTASISTRMQKFSLSEQEIKEHPLQPPRRAVLYVPGDNARPIEKVIELTKDNFRIDSVAFDCEDGVAMNRKKEARLSICNFFSNTVSKASNKVDWGVRVNSVKSGLLAEDIQVIFGSSTHKPKTIFLPKVNCTQDLDTFSKLLTHSLNHEKLDQKINLIFYAESCQSIMDLHEICRHAENLSHKTDCQFQPAGIVFGSDDFLATLGASRNVKDSTNILYARQRVVLVAKAFNLQAIDMVYIDFKDWKGLEEQSLEGANLGYTGKQVIHPDQIKIVQAAFMPSKEKIKWASEILESYRHHQASGKGVFVFRNQMIDNPTVEQAFNIIKFSQLENQKD